MKILCRREKDMSFSSRREFFHFFLEVNISINIRPRNNQKTKLCYLLFLQPRFLKIEAVEKLPSQITHKKTCRKRPPPADSQQSKLKKKS